MFYDSIEGEAKIRHMPIHNAPANITKMYLWNYKEKAYRCKNNKNLKKKDCQTSQMKCVRLKLELLQRMITLFPK